MPDSGGKLTQDEKQKIADWLKERSQGANPVCPVCGDPHWFIADHLVQPITYSGGGLSIGGPGYPQAMLVSAKCGYTRFLNAVVIGIVPGGKEPETKKPE